MFQRHLNHQGSNLAAIGDLFRNMTLLLKLALCLLLALACARVQALELQAQPVRINLTQAVEVLEDPGGKLGIDDVRSPAMAAQFTPVQAGVDTLNFGFTRSAYWLRVQLHRAPTTQSNWLLEVPYTNINTLDFYPPEGPAVLTGSQRPLASRQLFHRHFGFTLLPSTEAQYFYMRATSSYALTIPLAANLARRLNMPMPTSDTPPLNAHTGHELPHAHGSHCKVSVVGCSVAPMVLVSAAGAGFFKAAKRSICDREIKCA